MEKKYIDYYAKHASIPLPDERRTITYSFNDIERTITGIILERDNLIFIYEYRGKYIGNEFFISFSKNSISYKLIKVTEEVI